jgi:hypothetical protein
MFDKVFGLPTHALAVHAPVVLVPIAGLVTVALAVRPDWRRTIGWWMVLFLGFNVVALFIARQSGQALDDAFDGAVDVSAHRDLANQTLVFAIIWLILYSALVYRDHQLVAARALSADAVPTAERDRSRDAVAIGLEIAVGIVAILTTIWLIRTGHEGAYPTWKPTVDFYLPD